MASGYSPPSIEAILEASEDEPGTTQRNKTGEQENSTRRREQHRDTIMSPIKDSSDKAKEKSRKSHRSSQSATIRSSTKSKPRSTNSRRGNVSASRNEASAGRPRHRRTVSNHSISSNSSTDDEDEHEDHRVVLAAARDRLTSPSLISTLTSLTTATNNSGGSSGSNSTITQASMSRHSASKRPESVPEGPMSPAVPDPPDVFAFLEKDDPDEMEAAENAEEEGEEQDYVPPNWPCPEVYSRPSTPEHLKSRQRSASSSVSSSFHSDGSSEVPADNDTDRSTSPERSVKGDDNSTKGSDHEDISIARPDPAIPTSPAAAKFASQMLAAQHRQNMHSSMPSSMHSAYSLHPAHPAHSPVNQQFGTPQMPRGNANLPIIPPSQLIAPSPRYANAGHMHQRSLPRAQKLPVSGYEALASALSTPRPAFSEENDGSAVGIAPIYRKFSSLNHRLLLHLQDELSELEEQLHRLDSADTASRSMIHHNSSNEEESGRRKVLPASRRASALAGGELEWHKIDLTNRIAFKLSQYNTALTSFNNLSKSMSPADHGEIEKYRGFLGEEKLIAESETKFLTHEDDLISVCSEQTSSFQPTPSTLSMTSSIMTEGSAMISGGIPTLPSLAMAIAAAVLIPILTFNVIPGFLGRMTVVLLVALGVVGALVQSGIPARKMLETEGLMCSGIYGGLMVVLAGIVS